MISKHQNRKMSPKKMKGYMTLLSVLVVGAVGIATSISIIGLGLSFSQAVFTYQKLAESRTLVDACLEEGLEQIRESTTFTGGGTLSVGSKSCIYMVTDLGGENRRITSSATIGTMVRKGVVEITAIHPTIEVSSWREVDTF